MAFTYNYHHFHLPSLWQQSCLFFSRHIYSRRMSMARPIRIEFPGAIYHIYARGNRQEHIFLDDKDRILFLKLLADNAKRLNWLCHAYCLMGNHYHLLLETPAGILSSGIQIINSVYAKRFNRKYGQVGHLFQGRY